MQDFKRSTNAKAFAKEWAGRDYKEKGNVGKFWIELLEQIFGIENASKDIEREVSVPNMKNSTDFIDVYIPSTRVLIEQKAPYLPLDRPEERSFGYVTPYEQAKHYDDNLPLNKKAKWIVTCNFHWFYIYDMNASGTHPKPTTLRLKDLWRYYYQLDFLVDPTRQDIKKETHVSVRACNIINSIYHQLLSQYDNPDDPKVLRDVNKICVRLVFCLYADDSGIFGHYEMFHDYMETVPCQYWNVMLERLFTVLDTPEDKRHQDQLDPKIAKFPYVNGGMFADNPSEHVRIPNFDDSIADLVLNAGDNFDWSQISPTIFGALFESTLNPEERHTNGMHYTSVQNIHKVIDPLFLNELRHELNVIKTKYTSTNAIHRHAKAFQNKLASLTFLDPACGSGNFLTETYLCLRKLENEAIKLQLGSGGQIQTKLGLNQHLIKVSIHQFYGIEINDFAVSVAKTAMWIAESQMVQETQDIIQQRIKFLPLKSNSNIIEANALEMNWSKLVNPMDLNYIISNPPFAGDRRSKQQKADMKHVMKNFKSIGRLDFVACWYELSANMMNINKHIKTALVSTNSITQGVQVGILWPPLLKLGIRIYFAHQSFEWHNSAKNEAKVTCVIIGMGYNKSQYATLFTNHGAMRVKNISPYLRPLPNIIAPRRNKPLCKVPKMQYGNKPTDKGYLSKYSTADKNQIIHKYPNARKYFKRIIGAREFIDGHYRWCLWLYNTDSKWISIPPIKNAVNEVKKYREASKAKSTRDYPYPYLFRQIGQPTTNYLVLPKTSSLKRKYIPIGFINKNIIVTDKCFVIPHASLYIFGVIQSLVHMDWVDLVSGRMRNAGYEYTTKIVYNNFPWPKVTNTQKKIISKTAQTILDARKHHNGESLADLYNPLSMPPDLQKVHRANDKAVLKAYGLSPHASKNEIITKLLKMYKELSK